MSAPPVMQFCDIGRTYAGPPSVVALRSADLRIARDEYVAVVGPSGSGKSTFLNVAGLLDRPTQGTYYLDGIDTATLGERDRTAMRGRRIGFVFQSFHLLDHRSALENVTLSLLYTGVGRRQRRARSMETLEWVGLAHRAHAPARQLSGGEQQRVAIARALVNRPSLLLCDEPTGNLDTTTAAIVLDLIDELRRDSYTVLTVTHDFGVAARAHRTVVIRDGVLREAGRAEVMRGVAQASTSLPSLTSEDTDPEKGQL